MSLKLFWRILFDRNLFTVGHKAVQIRNSWHSCSIVADSNFLHSSTSSVDITAPQKTKKQIPYLKTASVCVIGKKTVLESFYLSNLVPEVSVCQILLFQNRAMQIEEDSN